jgi:glycosyltransferase involved in cell wall biosynthesis
MDYVVAAANATAACHQHVILLCLGAGPVVLDGLDPLVTLRRPGRQSGDELATELGAADIYLAAFDDGLSTRRTTFMAALQHGLPVVGTYGVLTEPELRREETAIHWTPTGDPKPFADACLDLASDAALRQRCGADARALYDRRFSWELIGDIVLRALSTSAARQ